MKIKIKLKNIFIEKPRDSRDEDNILKLTSIFFYFLPEIQKVRESGKIPPRDLKYVDIYREKQIRVTVKVLVPVKEHPKVI